jgi:feruloyl-CoA hydratase/lyase
MTVQRQCVNVERHNGISWVYLNRPEKKNAMSPQLHLEMDAVLEELEADPETKVVLIGGAGGNFCAGQDLKEFFRDLENKPAEFKRISKVASRWRWERLYMYDKPTICMVDGYCAGGAFMQLVAVDFVVTAKEATFSLSEVNWGIIPGALVAKAVTEATGYRDALYYACLGDPFDGDEAKRIGLANICVPREQLVEETEKLARKLMAKSPAVLRATKQAMRSVRTMDVQQAYDYLDVKTAAIRVSDPEQSYHTGLTQFLDKKTFRPVYEPFALGTLLTDHTKK